MRRTKPEKREVIPDLRYNSMTVSILVNRIMKNGKKSAAVRMMYDAMDILHEKTDKDAIGSFGNCTQECWSVDGSKAAACWWRYLSGSDGSFHFPSGQLLPCAGSWMLPAIAPANPLLNVWPLNSLMLYNQQGTAMRKREEAHKMAEANRAFSHYRV